MLGYKGLKFKTLKTFVVFLLFIPTLLVLY